MTTFLIILKIIGIVAGSVIALAILLCLLILLCPETYKLKAKGKNAEMTLSFDICWIFGIARLRAAYTDRKLTYSARILGIRIFKEDAQTRQPQQLQLKKEEKVSPAPKKTVAEKVSEVLEKIKTVWEKTKTVKYILGAPVTHRAWTALKRQMLDILRAVFPRRMSGSLEFGTGDPAMTAQVYGIANAIVIAIDDRLILQPNMEEKIANADFSIKGRIFNLHVLICVLRIVKNRDIRRVISYIRRNL